MISIGCFSEMNCFDDNGSIKEHIIDKVNYDKKSVIEYLQSQKRIAGCPRSAIDCVTGEIISPSFSVYSDGEYQWCDFLIYHIKNYEIFLPKDFLNKIEQLNRHTL